MDDLFDFGVPSQSPARRSADRAPMAQAELAQYGSRRELRAAQGARRVEIVESAAVPARRARGMAKAAVRRRALSRPSGDRKAVRVVASTPQGKRKHPLSVLATMSVVGGLFAVAGLPAYATIDQQLTSAKSDAHTQSIIVSSDATAAATERDGYHATTPAQLAEMSKDSLRAANNTAYLASGARELGDDYPWAYELSSDQGGGLSPLNYYFRECVDFVAWRLNRDAGSFAEPYRWVWSNLTPTGGNASQWKYAWEQHGWTISTTPVVGSVAWFGYSNHVAYVKAVLPDGNVLLEEYNYGYSALYGQRTIPAADVAAFLYPPT